MVATGLMARSYYQFNPITHHIIGYTKGESFVFIFINYTYLLRDNP